MMETNQSARILDLIVMLTSASRLSALDIADRLGMTRRGVYNYLHLLADYGFKVRKEGCHYSLDPRSPFFRRLDENIPLSDAEAEYVCHTLADADRSDVMASRLRAKLTRHFGLDDIAADTESATRISNNKAQLRLAMKTERIAKISNYSSPHSQTIHDRYVEPYMFLNNGRDVRCHEIATHTNKTFKLSRMGSVEVMDDSWFNKPMHRPVHTDIFMFSGEEHHNIKLRLGQLSHNLMVEEYPLSDTCITPDADGKHWMLNIEVASYLGIGRFVLGLFDDIEIVGDDGFKAYIHNKVAAMGVGTHDGIGA